MENFTLYNSVLLEKHLNAREGEEKLGEKVTLLNSFEELEEHEAKYVIFGIPEDIGVQGNHGKKGTEKAWESFLGTFLNVQANEYNSPENCILLGEVNCQAFTQEAEIILAQRENPLEKLGELVNKIDMIGAEVVEKIISAGKIPIIIGGGHNNAYGNIKGTSKAINRHINVVNIDAHTDLRTCDYRHSGNGFSYAKQEDFLNYYSIVGLHKNYTPQYIFDLMNNDKTIDFTLFEEYLHLNPLEKLVKLKKAFDFARNHFGLEIDCDAIQNFSSSAMGPTGFSVNDIRSFLKLARKEDVLYLHLCEASPDKSPLIGKALSYFVSDFIRPLD
ncbi:formimidoylglutamase [Mesonia maritima]|uniref:Formiminoglutamase n=1 Tax=Mesonia maritima TaxID=1793873 RepID=A0ABU1K6B5_9FLAO|nr:formimidoylglutamase [Mesonia maritima]MDR6301154.1 formiminoglutamase [Mesonia maritima]